MQCITLATILRELSVSHVDYLTVAVEGHELEVLQSVDWAATTFDLIAVDIQSSDSRRQQQITDLLESNGLARAPWDDRTVAYTRA